MMIVFGVAVFFVVVNGQEINLEPRSVIENENIILDRVRMILSDFSQLQLRNLQGAVSSATNFLIASAYKIFNVLDPMIVSLYWMTSDLTIF